MEVLEFRGAGGTAANLPSAGAVDNGGGSLGVGCRTVARLDGGP